MNNDDLDFGATLRGFTPGQHVFNRYVLTRILGQGGMGIVWLAHDEKLEQDVALKFLPEAIARDEEAIRDLKRETKKSLRLTHPRIVRIHDFVDDDRAAAVSMEYVDGRTLSSLKLDEPECCFDAAKLRPWIQQLCEALTYAHGEAKIAHRDLKPANLMIDRNGMLKVADFGISATLTDSTTRASHTASTSGTPVYMSPQQMLGQRAEPTDDIYSMGATIYELLTGKPPFYSGNIPMQVQGITPPPMTARRKELGVEDAAPIPQAWEKTVAACLAKDAKDRPQSAAEVWALLEGDEARAVELREQAMADAENRRKTGKSDGADLSAGETVAGGAARNAPTTNPSKAGRTLRPAVTKTAAKPSRRSKAPLYAALSAGVLLVAGLGGWWYGIHQPEVRRQAEIVRLEAEGKAAEAMRLRNEQERQAAEAAASAKAEQEEAARLAAARGSVIVRTTPAGAEVQFGAEAMEPSPLTLKSLKLGKYPVRVSMPGYDDWAGEAQILENEFTRVDVQLIRQTGVLKLDTTPSGQTWKLVDQPADSDITRRSGTTPVTLGKVPTGQYTVEFTRQGWPAVRRSVSVDKDTTASASAEFASGRVELTSNPTGAEVIDANGKNCGKTPLIWPEIPTGTYTLTLRADGYSDAAISGELGKDETLRLNAELKRKPGPQTGANMTVPDYNIEMIWISPGSFQMGSPTSEAGRDNDEVQHRVTLSKGYWLGKYEVTQGQWKAVMGTTLRDQVVKALNDDTLYNVGGKNQTLRDFWGAKRDADPATRMGAEQDDLPMYYVNYDEAQEFCRRLTKKERAEGRLPEGYEYRLPSEAQWEYACRAGTGTSTYGGEMKILGENNAPILDAIAWYGGNSSVGFTGSGWDTSGWKEKQYAGGNAGPRVVGTKQANRWGLYDMHGNVWEWCNDWYGDYPSGAVTDPTGVASGSYRVSRGGSWYFMALFCRSAFRFVNTPGYRFISIGFRLALSSVQ
jgi:formylglycine-generating enzyme required for sulfatase activity